MTKIAVSSDNHLDVNRQDLNKVVQQQAQYLIDNGVDIYFFAGDLSNNFETTINFFEMLQEILKNNIQVFFIAGNHDMGRGISYEELESLNHELYFHNRNMIIEDVNFIGNNGWYDYSFVGDDYSLDKIESFKRSLWYDRLIKQPMSDPERLEISNQQISNRVEPNKSNILITHFVPNEFQIRRFKDKPRFDIVNAFLGSNKTNSVLYENNFHDVFYGHLHMTANYELNGIAFHNISVGDKREINSPTFIQSWKEKIFLFDI